MSKFDLEECAKTAERIRKKAIDEGRWIDNPSEEEMRRLVAEEPGIKQSVYGNFVAESEPTSRAAMFTENSVDAPFGEEERRLLVQCERSLAKETLICVDRVVGNRDSKTTVRLIVPKDFAHSAYGGGKLFLAPSWEVKEPTYQILFFTDGSFEANKKKPLPEKDISIRLAMLDDGRMVKVCRNSNYIGEYKKGVFAAEDWNAKARGGIFLHAGCREDYLQSVHGDYRTSRTCLLALSANGKTSTTCRILARKGKEKSWLIQDDGGALMPDGSFHGFECSGVFVKTEGVNPGDQQEIYYGLLKPQTLCENVHINGDRYPDFYKVDRTTNGRAVIPRRDFMHASSYIDVEKVDNLILITRGPMIPAIVKLDLHQTVAMMILGQAMESSAGDPTKAGKIRSEFFYDPFVCGDRAEHANRFYEILKGLPHMNFYLLNTGGVGEGIRYKEITLEHTMAILDSLLRGGLEDWEDSPTGFKIPKAIRMVDDIYLHPEKLYTDEEFEEKQKKIDKFRRKALRKVGDDIPPEIKKVFKTKRKPRSG